MVGWNLCQAHLKVVGLTQIMANHDSQTIVIDCQFILNMFVQQ